jgi:uncharacterized damage-inducible protein DinB
MSTGDVTDDGVEIRLTKPDLLARMAETRAEVEAVIGQYTEAEVTRPGAEGWSVKDHLSHLAVWEAPIRALLQGESLAVALGVDQETFKHGGINRINEVIQLRHKDEPLAHVMARLRESRQETLTLLERFTDADLLKPYSFYRPSVDPPRTDPVILWVSGSTYEHDAQHLVWMRELLVAPV